MTKAPLLALLPALLLACGPPASDDGPAHSGDVPELRTLEFSPGLPDFSPFEEGTFEDARHAWIDMPAGERDLTLVVAKRAGQKEYWWFRRRSSGSISLTSAHGGLNQIAIDESVKRELQLEIDEETGEIRWAWGEIVPPSAFRIGEPSPDLAAVLLDGETFLLSEFRGRATVVVNWWATWCLPCVEEMPELNALVRHHEGQPVEFMAMTGEPADTVRDFVSRHEFLFRQAVAEQPTAELLGDEFPRHIVVSPEGRVVFDKKGYGPSTVAQVRASIEAIGQSGLGSDPSRGAAAAHSPGRQGL